MGIIHRKILIIRLVHDVSTTISHIMKYKALIDESNFHLIISCSIMIRKYETAKCQL